MSSDVIAHDGMLLSTVSELSLAFLESRHQDA